MAVAVVLDAKADADVFLGPLETARVPVHRIIAPRRGYLGERRAVRALVAAMTPDVVHSHGYRPDVIDSGMIRRLGIATVTTAHGYTGGALRNRLYEAIQRFAFRRFDAVIAVSEPLGALLHTAGVPADRLHVVPNGFIQIVEPLERGAARIALDLPPNEFVVGWVGRMIKEKGLDLLVDAVSELHDIELVICAVGAGPERDIVEQKATRLGLADRIRWCGLVPEAARYFRAFDLFVISSRTEGLPISLLEAIASDVPIVSTRVGGIPQAVASPEAILVDPEQPAQLARAIRAVHSDGPLAAARAQRAQMRLASDFGAEQWLARHAQVYSIAMQRRSLHGVTGTQRE